MQLQIKNRAGHTLAVHIDFPTQGLRGCAVFAHCFTCGKDLRSARLMAQALTQEGIAVARFDFTGLGRSEGEFADTSFSSNVSDLIDVANGLPDAIPQPFLLMGHSLGGAAVLAAAHQLPSVKAVVTVAAPSVASHVQHLFAGAADAIARDGSAPVAIGMRDVTIGQSLLSDLQNYTSTEQIAGLKRALLVMHAPLDNVVSVEEASAIFSAAKHPKSFVSLDKADHMLSNPKDATFAGRVIAAWAQQHLDEIAEPEVGEGTVRIGELDEKFLRSMSTHKHTVIADEPKRVGGGDQGPTPYDLLLMALGACTSMTLRMYVNRKQWDLGEITVDLRHDRQHCEDCNEGKGGKIEVLTREISTEKPITEEQHAALLRIADKCPVHLTLEAHPRIDTVVVESPE